MGRKCRPAVILQLQCVFRIAPGMSKIVSSVPCVKICLYSVSSIEGERKESLFCFTVQKLPQELKT